MTSDNYIDFDAVIKFKEVEMTLLEKGYPKEQIETALASIKLLPEAEHKSREFLREFIANWHAPKFAFLHVFGDSFNTERFGHIPIVEAIALLMIGYFLRDLEVHSTEEL